jgi:phospholipase C
MTENWKFRRRTFLKHGAQAATLAGLSGLFPETLRRALAIEPDIRTGTIQDVQHVVILMQENRSFDHYFGHLNGVRGFNDPRALKRQAGLVPELQVRVLPLSLGYQSHQRPVGEFAEP